MMTIRRTLYEISDKLRKSGIEQPVFEARRLMQEALERTAGELLIGDGEELTDQQVALVRLWTRSRRLGKPLAYLSNRKGFYKHDFIVEQGILIPRPETELVVETALKRWNKKTGTIADLGCGTGCIGLSLLKEMSRAKLLAIDNNPKAVRVAGENAKNLRVSRRAKICYGKVETWRPGVKFDVIVANPPYIAIGDKRVDEAVHEYEPHSALYSGKDGLDAIKVWSKWTFANLKSKGLFVCEFGAGQNEAVRAIISQAGFQDIETSRDLSGIERVVSAFKTR